MSWQDKEHYARLRAGERPKPRREFGRGVTRVALVFPNSYYVGMSNLGFHTIYSILNSSPGLLCDRFFPLDWTSSDPPLSLDCEAPLSDFDAIAFSVAFENDYVNVLRTLDLARIPLRSVERDASHPLVVVGGAITFMNPEPIADFADVIVMGEADDSALRLFETVGGYRHSERAAMLEAASEVEGVYVPALEPDGPPAPQPLRAAAQGDGRRIAPEYISHSAIVGAETEFSDTFLMEISRGCPYKCRFCAVGHRHPHARNASADDLLELAERRLVAGRPRPPVRRVGLVSPSVGAHPELEVICAGLRSLGLDITVSSIRVDGLSDFMLVCLAESGTRTVTIAPEAGSERLRLVVRKGLPEEAVIDAAARAVGCGVPNVKLYFMVGLPTETEEDVYALLDLAVRVRRVMDGMVGAPGGGAGTRAGLLTVSLAPFVPKPGTPFQWSPMARQPEVKRRISILRRGLARVRGVRVTSETLRSAYLQGILARGGREIAPFLECTYRNGGDWKRAAAEVGLDVDSCLGERSLGRRLPWSSMTSADTLEKLGWEYRKALSLRRGRRA
jgi:radical SAM superfamily enzyme YgiQ (UPF0313 family)